MIGMRFGVSRLLCCVALSAALATPLSACAADELTEKLGPLGLPESDGIEDAPWPSLADAPDPVSQTGATGIEGMSLRSKAVVEASQIEAEEMQRKTETIIARPVLTSDMRAIARRMRARAARSRE